MTMHPNRRVVFDSVRRVREGNEAHRHLSWARHTMRIPEQDFWALRKLYPDLANFADPEAQRAAWDRFEKSPFSEPYRIGRIVRGIVKNGVIQK
jgi:hypothetical protein